MDILGPKPRVRFPDGSLAPEREPKLPTDAEQILAWADKLQAWGDADEPANSGSFYLFRPHVKAADALLRYSLKYPHIVKQISDAKDFCERLYERLPDAGAAEDLTVAMDDLRGRIFEGMKVIQAAERLPRISMAEANIKAREHLNKHRDAKVRDIANGIGCSVGLVAQLSAWKAVQSERQKGRKPKAPGAVGLTDAVIANTGKKDATLQRLIGEQQDDYEPSPLDPAGRSVRYRKSV
jgi:hypothetical protein